MLIAQHGQLAVHTGMDSQLLYLRQKKKKILVELAYSETTLVLEEYGCDTTAFTQPLFGN